MEWEHWQHLDCKAVGKKKQKWGGTVRGGEHAWLSAMAALAMTLSWTVPHPCVCPHHSHSRTASAPCLLVKAQLGKNLHYNPGCCGHSNKKKKIKPPKASTTSKLSACHFSTHVCCGLQEIFWAFKRPTIKDLCLIWVWFLHLSFSSLVNSSRNLAG